MTEQLNNNKCLWTKQLFEKEHREFPGGTVVRTPSLVGELRSCITAGSEPKKKKERQREEKQYNKCNINKHTKWLFMFSGEHRMGNKFKDKENRQLNRKGEEEKGK